MSRTDKTRPYWVKERELRNLFPRTDDDWPRTYRAYKWWHPHFRCGCPMCGYDAFSVPRRRLERYEGKRYTRNWWREYE